ncbi:MAG: hypothetical protein Q4B06_00605 [Candidatus Saccharibacteria bacterium]|nr:hypothetical protein [Candidatus Saccharibacteria bacterium]
MGSAKRTSARKTAKKSVAKKMNKSAVPKGVKGWFVRIRQRVKDFLQRRPHRSFRMTRRRDYKRSLKLPGYFAFTIEVTQLLWKHKLTFGLLMLVFLVLIVLFGLMGSQNIYSEMRELLDASAPDQLFQGATGEIGKAGVILLTAVTGGLSSKPDSGQIVVATLLSLYIWLVVVWLLRHIVAGKRVKLRDGLYNAGSPIISTALLMIVLLVQMVPGAVAILIASAAWQSKLIDTAAASMLLSIGLVFIAVLSLYWMVSTIIALIVVTLPGMYPLRALAISSDMVIGRRLRIMYRFVWMLAVVVSWWIVIMIPVILFDGWIKSIFEQIEWLPIVPVALLLMGIVTIVWMCAYVYLLYRKVVDDDSAPA